LTLRSGWLCKQDQPTFEAFLRPLKQLEWPILAVLSDKQTGLMPALRTVFPNSHYQFCQAHYLRNLAEPLAEIDSAFKVDLRKAVRQHVGNLIRQEPRCDPKQGSVLTVTGLLPSPISMPNVSGVSVAQSAIELPPEVEADAVIMQLLRRTRYLLTLKGRPPFRLAGMATYERLDEVASLSLDLLTQRYDPRLAQLYQGLQSALLPFTQTYQDLQQGAAWLRDIAYILEPVSPQALKGEQVAAQLHGYLGAIRCQHDVSPAICDFTLHLDKVTRSYWPGLFHCYEVAGLPRTNNEIESHFRDTGRQILRITGQKGLTGRTLQRQGAWELLPRPATEAKLLNGLSQIPPEDLAQERQRFAQHRERFRLQSRSTRQTQIQFAQLRQRWAALSPTGTG
jgi:Transposase, Mutator family